MQKRKKKKKRKKKPPRIEEPKNRKSTEKKRNMPQLQAFGSSSNDISSTNTEIVLFKILLKFCKAVQLTPPLTASALYHFRSAEQYHLHS